jgi:hypothetical protein
MARFLALAQEDENTWYEQAIITYLKGDLETAKSLCTSFLVKVKTPTVMPMRTRAEELALTLARQAEPRDVTVLEAAVAFSRGDIDRAVDMVRGYLLRNSDDAWIGGYLELLLDRELDLAVTRKGVE